MSRPPDGAQRRSLIIHVRLTDAERRAIDRRRGAMSLSGFIRAALRAYMREQ